MSRLCLYYRLEPERDRWAPGDRWLRPLVRRVVRGKPRPGGVDKVFINLCLGLDQLGLPYQVNLPFRQLRPDDRVAILGRGRHCLDGYDRPNKIVAGIGLMTHPSEWPTLCTDYPVVRYLQHCEWSDRIYRPYFGDRCAIWPVGIDTDSWTPGASPRKIDFLVYAKYRWELEQHERELGKPIRAALESRGLSYQVIEYGHYAPEQFREALAQCRAMIYLSSHESQGIACQEAMSANVPVLAWDPGFVLDHERFKWGQAEIPATSVPYFDQRCGLRFKDSADFARLLPEFLDRLNRGSFAPRAYILENLTLAACARRFCDIVEAAQ